MFTTLQTTTIDQLGIGLSENANARRIAAKLFDYAYERGVFSRIIGKFIGKTNGLRTLSRRPEASARSTRTLVVPLDKIVGTEGRSDDFDASFRPLKKHNRERWISIAAARRAGVALPAVELVQDGNVYYVRDGHHRISVARMMGQLDIDARVVN